MIARMAKIDRARVGGIDPNAAAPAVPDGGPAAEPVDPELERLRREILRRVSPTLSGAGIPGHGTECRLEPEVTSLNVRLDVPSPVSPAVRRAVAVRVLDAVRTAGRTFGPVQVSIHAGGRGTTPGAGPGRR